MNNKYDFIQADYKIGYNCTFMAFSAIFESKNLLSYALAYTNSDFLYNYHSFITCENTANAELLISKTNQLIIEKNPRWIFHKSYNKNIFNLVNKYDLFEPFFIEFDKDSIIGVEQIKKEYIDKGLPIIFKCDHYYLYNEYKKKTKDILHYHSSGHSAVLLDIDINNNSCIVSDKFFSFFGEVKLSSLLSSMKSNYICNPGFGYIDIKKLEKISEEERIYKYLKENIINTLIDEISIDGIKYYKNIKGLKMFVDDFDDITKSLTESKGIYAPQFTVNLVQPIILQRRSFSNLLKYINKNSKNIRLERIQSICDEVSKLWFRIDMLCDKCFLSGNSLTDYKERILKVLKQIYEYESVIHETLSKIYIKM